MKPKKLDKFRFHDGSLGTIKEKYSQLGAYKWPIVIVWSSHGVTPYAVSNLEIVANMIDTRTNVWAVKSHDTKSAS